MQLNEGMEVMGDADHALAIRVVVSFFVGMLIIFATSRALGPERKAEWFQKRRKYSFFNRRGFAGEAFHFGYPRTREGLGVALCMFGAVGLAGYLIIFGF